MRLQKFMAKAGVASRRKSEEIISKGLVSVNDEVIQTQGTKVDPDKDIVLVDGREIFLEEEKVYYMLNKPEGYITSVKDEKDRKTVLDILKDVDQRIYPVGRLDFDTSGLLLLTNDGDLTYLITHPKHEVPKRYEALVDGVPTSEELVAFRNGLMIEGRKTAKAKIEISEKDVKTSKLVITIIEGRNRQVRKMCASIGHPVIKLKRIGVGKLELGDLALGSYRMLTKKETNHLKNL